MDSAPSQRAKDDRSHKKVQTKGTKAPDVKGSDPDRRDNATSVATARAASPKQPITMLADRVLAQQPQADGERRSRAGILIPATAQVSRRLVWAEVLAVGPHVRTVKTGDKILFNPEDRFEVEVQGDEYVILRERDIHAVASERIDSGTGLYL